MVFWETFSWKWTKPAHRFKENNWQYLLPTVNFKLSSEKWEFWKTCVNVLQPKTTETFLQLSKLGLLLTQREKIRHKPGASQKEGAGRSCCRIWTVADLGADLRKWPSICCQEAVVILWLGSSKTLPIEGRLAWGQSCNWWRSQSARKRHLVFWYVALWPWFSSVLKRNYYVACSALFYHGLRVSLPEAVFCEII